MTGHFQGKTALVTGAAGGIGAALCRQLVADGARVAAIDVDEARLALLAAALGSSCLPFACDLRDEAACAAVVERVRDTFGVLDVLINNAGVSHHSCFRETSPEVLRQVMDVNFYGSVHITRAALPALIDRRGVIAVVSSVAGLAPLLERSAYAASKHALHGLFESLAAEVRPLGVAVVMVCPSFVRTDIDARAFTGTGGIGVAKKKVTGKVVEPEALAAEMLRAIARRRRRLVPSPVGKLSLALSAFAPGLYERLMVRSVSRSPRP